MNDLTFDWQTIEAPIPYKVAFFKKILQGLPVIIFFLVGYYFLTRQQEAMSPISLFIMGLIPIFLIWLVLIFFGAKMATKSQRPIHSYKIDKDGLMIENKIIEIHELRNTDNEQLLDRMESTDDESNEAIQTKSALTIILSSNSGSIELKFNTIKDKQQFAQVLKKLLSN